MEFNYIHLIKSKENKSSEKKTKQHNIDLLKQPPQGVLLQTNYIWEFDNKGMCHKYV